MGRKKGPVNEAERSQRQMAAMHPRTPGPSASAKEEAAVKFGESLDAATLRLQIARANTEELDQQKRQLELDKAKGALVSKDAAVDLAQACLLRAATVFDMLPERLRDRLDPSLHHVCDVVDEIIRDCRTEVATID